MDDIEKHARQYLKALYGVGETSDTVLPAQICPPFSHSPGRKAGSSKARKAATASLRSG